MHSGPPACLPAPFALECVPAVFAGGGATHLIWFEWLDHCGDCLSVWAPLRRCVCLCVLAAAAARHGDPHPPFDFQLAASSSAVCPCTRAGRSAAGDPSWPHDDPRAILHSHSCFSIGAQAKANRGSATRLTLSLSRITQRQRCESHTAADGVARRGAVRYHALSALISLACCASASAPADHPPHATPLPVTAGDQCGSAH